jgi:hypothetical protein
MKPKTKIHFEILKLHNKLPKITETQLKWAYKECFKLYVWKTKHKAVCFECGHGWDQETNLITKLFPVVCPKCKKKLEIVDGHAWRKTEDEYLQIFTTIGDYQVIRMVQMYKHCMKGVASHYAFFEIYQHWIKGDGQMFVLSTHFNSMGQWCQGMGWSWIGPMELRAEYRGTFHDRYFIQPSVTYPRRKIHPNIIRNGWTTEFFGYGASTFFRLLLSTPMFETFLKAGQYGLIKEFNHYDHKIATYWTQIKICMRHSYRIDDPSIWFDYIGLMKHFHKNIYDPALLCPRNLNQSHRTLMEAKRLADERNRIASQEKADIDNIECKKAKKKLMHLSFTDGEITIVPLKNIMDFKNEERILDHCVYSSEYHKKDTSFMMSARIGAERLETLEISLRDFKVKQCRGYDNKDSKYHSQILKLMEKHLPEIRKAFYTREEPKRNVKRAVAA